MLCLRHVFVDAGLPQTASYCGPFQEQEPLSCCDCAHLAHIQAPLLNQIHNLKKLWSRKILICFLGPPEDTRIVVPDGAVDLFPNKLGPRILHLPDQDRVLKAGANVRMSEA
jgi:hypothetical protein